MLFENFQLGRLILHEVFRRRPDKLVVAPRYGDALVTLGGEALDVFRKRVIDALGSTGQSMEMSIVDGGAGSAVHLADELLYATDDDFIVSSKKYADKLASAQLAINLPGGIVIVFDGTAGNPARRIVGVLKAETHSGFRKSDNGASLTVEFFTDLFLSPQTKLYKIGVFVKEQSDGSPFDHHNWKSIVYDSLMTAANRQNAAQYFYETFLGCAVPKNAAHLTKVFFDGTREFIEKTGLGAKEKADLLTGLYTYLKVDQSPTIEVKKFSDAYLPNSVKDDYQTFMRGKKFPANAVQKDNSDISRSLRLRSLSFNKNIRLTASPEDFADAITIETVEGPPGAGGVKPEWTRITIKDRVVSQS